MTRVWTVLAASFLVAGSTMVDLLVIQTGALGILGWSVWHLLARALPIERAAFLAANKEIREEFRDVLDDLIEVISDLSKAVNSIGSQEEE